MAPSVPNASVVNALVAKWAAKHPDLADRLERAAALVANVRGSGSTFVVEGSDGHHYTVKVDRKARTSSCTCPDHKKRGLRCKHVLSVALIVAGSS